MSTARDLERLRSALQKAVTASGLGRREISTELDRNPRHLGAMLRGAAPLRVEEVFHLLSVLDVRPYELFGHFFPLGGERMVEVRERFPPEKTLLTGVSTRLLDERALDMQGAARPSSVALALRVGRLLALMIRKKGATQKAVAAKLGMSSAALGNALRGKTQLTFRTVFGALEGIEITPGRFFAELLGAGGSEGLMDQLRWSWTLDRAEEHFTEVGKKLAERNDDLPE